MSIREIAGLIPTYQEAPIREIVVNDSSSTDETLSIAKEAGVKIMSVEPGSFDHSATRNKLYMKRQARC